MAESETPKLDDHVSQSEAKPAASEEYRHDAHVTTTTNSSSSTGANAGEGAYGNGGPSASATTTHHHHKPRFSALNINQRFLQSATAATAPKPALASAPPPPADESRTGPSPRLVTAMPGRMSAAQYHHHHHHPVTDASKHKEAPRDAPAAPRMPWANVNKRAPMMPTVSSQDFPTAKEVMEAERKAEERAAAHAAEEHARQQAMKEELERFRGTELMSHDHWDELEEESEDEMDDVVEFGDGTQYKISEVEEEQAKHAPPVQEPSPPPPPPPAPRVPAWGPTHRPASLLRRPEPPASSVTAHASPQPLPHSHPRAPSHAHHHLHAQPHHPPSTVAAPPPPPPVSTWGPLAQRHSTLTGKPMPKLEPTPPPPPKEDPKAIEAEQQNEMLTAAERARRRREEDERAREAERERARHKAAQIEEQMIAAERAKEEEREQERRREQQAREEQTRLRMEREQKAKQEAERSQASETGTWRRTTPLPKSLCTPPALAHDAPTATVTATEAGEGGKRTVATKHATAHKHSPAAGSPRTREGRELWHQSPEAHSHPETPPPPEPVTTRPELLFDDAPVWHKFPVRCPSRPHKSRPPSAAAKQRRMPNDSYALIQCIEPPADVLAGTYTCWTSVDMLFEPVTKTRASRGKPHVHLRRPPAPPASTSFFSSERQTFPAVHPIDETAFFQKHMRAIDSLPVDELFAQENDCLKDAQHEPRCHEPASLLPRCSCKLRVNLPKARSWHASTSTLTPLPSSSSAPAVPLLGLTYGGRLLGQDTFSPHFSTDRLDVHAPGTWGTSSLSFPIVGSTAHESTWHHPLKRMWSQASPASIPVRGTKNSLRDIADDPVPMPLSSHLADWDDHAEGTIAASASSWAPTYRPSYLVAPPSSLTAMATSSPPSHPLPLPHTQARTQPQPQPQTLSLATDPDPGGLLPGDYTDFVLSDTW